MDDPLRVNAAATQPAALSDLLGTWRAAERRWEGAGSAADVCAAAVVVVNAWAAYQDAARPASTEEFMLVADDEGTYVTATRAATTVLGYVPDELIGMRIADLAAGESRGTTAADWATFLAAGRQDGRFRLRAKDGHVVTLRYQARAHHPIPGFHVSRLWPDDAQPQDAT